MILRHHRNKPSEIVSIINIALTSRLSYFLKCSWHYKLKKIVMFQYGLIDKRNLKPRFIDINAKSLV